MLILIGIIFFALIVTLFTSTITHVADALEENEQDCELYGQCSLI